AAVGGVEQRAHGAASWLQAAAVKLERARDMPGLDVTTPLANPTPMPEATAAPTLAHPTAAAGAGSWCVASPSAGAAALQVALDYACGQGADCSPIQHGGSCADPDTVRDHASYAFNSFFSKRTNLVQTSCDFAGAAILTSTDPSTTSCKYPSTSTGASILNTTNPMTPVAPMFGSPPGGSYNSPPGPGGYYNSPPLYGSMSPPDYGGSISSATAMMPGSKSTTAVTTTLTCLLVTTMSLGLHK
ncbi:PLASMODESMATA CALLOSE-BINDING PROTEIN 3-like, partial [Triticum urartu]|uniref:PLASMODESMATA CALLOSE-BINDING PROTEIN 3-like n=1 Tax=Triticum urartu TaxID=4572 RepID=UPI0020437257